MIAPFLYYFLIGALTLGVYFDFLLFLLLVFRLRKNAEKNVPLVLPRVSVLVSARNEENIIEHTVLKLSKLDYPKELIEILIADDHSTDNTWETIKKLMEEYDNLQGYQFEQPSGYQENGKAYALEQLALKAKGDYYLFIDADSFVNSNALKTMISVVKEHVGIINGFSYPRGNNAFSAVQRADWVYHEVLIALTNSLGFFTTAYGHNMLISKEAYFTAGGMSLAKHSLTEDFALAKAIHQSGFDIKFLLSDAVVATKAPKVNWNEYLNQRTRWLLGALKGTFVLKGTYIYRQVQLPLALILTWYHPLAAAIIITFRLLTTGLVLWRGQQIFGVRAKWLHVIYHDLSSLVVFFVAFFRVVFLRSVIWKGRKYRI
jgi:cellulose synthase/poly-beta-1,6-N-acetylglucosamine synthase-like glycosyltransferase